MVSLRGPRLSEDLWCASLRDNLADAGLRRHLKLLGGSPSSYMHKELVQSWEAETGVLGDNLSICRLGHLWSTSEELKPGGPRDPYDEMLPGEPLALEPEAHHSTLARPSL